MSGNGDNVFANRHKFRDDVWGQIMLNDLERDVIDTPEFQRLFRTSQLGFVDLVYKTANHTRGAHSIGACGAAQILMRHLEENMRRLPGSARDRVPIRLAQTDRIIIRIAALLHDISHIPFSHDIERKTHKIPPRSPSDKPARMTSCHGIYDKHDEWEKNPLLYVLLFDRNRSVLARVLMHYSRAFHTQLLNDCAKEEHGHLQRLSDLLKQDIRFAWQPDVLPQLIFHVLLYETTQEFVDASTNEGLRSIATNFPPVNDEPAMPQDWGLGWSGAAPPLPKQLHGAWYQQFRHDVVGNTLCADLLDYLRRDSKSMRMGRKPDLNLLNYYVLRPDGNSADSRYSCAIDLYDHKRGAVRVELLNDIFRLLDLRHEIHEKAVTHRVVQSATAMLARALRLLGNVAPSLPEIVGIDSDSFDLHSLRGEDVFLADLLGRVRSELEPSSLSSASAQGGGLTVGDSRHNIENAERILKKLAERRVYRPLMLLTGNQAIEEICAHAADANSETNLRTLAALIDSERYLAFFLLVSAMAELHIQGLVDDNECLLEYLTRASKNRDLTWASRKPPARVILWTTPYKQLYKDPALVVAFDETSAPCRLDKLSDPAAAPAIAKAAFRRVSELKLDADGRYQIIWKICVFLSDSLFYTGVYTKLRDAAPVLTPPSHPTVHERSQSRDHRVTEHKKRLEEGAALMLMAMTAAFEDWMAKSSGMKKEEVERALTTPIDNAGLCGLVVNCRHKLGDFLTRAGYEDKIKSLTVHMEPYVHSDTDPNNGCYDPKCRDIRSKFDDNAQAAWNDASANGVRRLLECLGLKSNDLSRTEFTELGRRYERNRSRCDPLIAKIADNHPNSKLDAIQSLWANELELVGVQPGTPDQAELRPTAEPAWMDSDEALRRHLHDCLGTLPHYGSELRREIPAILGFLGQRPTHRKEIVMHLEERAANTAELLAAILKTKDRMPVMEILERKWPSDLGESVKDT